MKRFRRWKRWVLATSVLGVVALVVLWFSFQRIPSWYRPMVLPRADVQRVQNDMAVQFDRFSELLARTTKTFPYELSQQQLNEWLAAREEIWPLSRHWLPAELSDPQILLEDGAVRLAATYRSGSLSTVVSVRLRIEGKLDYLRVWLDSASVGAVPLPVSTLRDHLARLDATNWPAGQVSRYQSNAGSGPADVLPPLTDLLSETGARFPTAWVWPNGKRHYWIRRLAIDPQGVVMEIEPLPR